MASRSHLLTLIAVLQISQLCFAAFPYKERFIAQYVDHFNFASSGAAGPNSIYHQRYLFQDKYWAKEKNAPIFFYCGNEGPITSFWDNSGFVFEVAEQFQALIVFGEHRYYGKSMPFGNVSLTKKYTGYLTMDQALADYAYLLKHIKLKYNAENSPVVTFGGSYGGMLSGYFRYKYPHIVDMAIASSAPFYTIAGGRPRSEFFEAVTNTFRKADPNCPAYVQEAFSQLYRLFRTGVLGQESIERTFRLCPGQIRKKNFENHMYSWARNAFTILAMADYPYPTTFLAPLPGYPVKVACASIKGAETKIEGLASIVDLVLGKQVKCHDTYAEYVECADPTGCGVGPAGLAWDYQACTEIVTPGGSNNVTDMFPKIDNTIEMRTEHCDKTWNLGDPRLNWLSTHFWGSEHDIKQASKIVFPNGDLDPWMPGGVLHDLSPTLKAIMIKGGAHHLDLRASNPKDPESVIEARKEIAKYITEWVLNTQNEINV